MHQVDRTGSGPVIRPRIMQAGLVLVAMISACDPVPEVDVSSRVPVAAVSITPTNSVLSVGASFRLNVTLADPAGNILPDRHAGGSLQTPSSDGQGVAVIADVRGRSGRVVTWRSDDPGIVAVDGRGVVTGLRPGETTVRATSEGRSATSRVTVSDPARGELSVIPARATLLAGQSLALETTPPAGDDAASVWTVDTPSLASVNAAGRVLALAPGAATITVSDGQHSAAAELTILPSSPLRGLDFPGNAGTATTLRFEFVPAPAPFPATYIWRSYPRQQQSYYTAFFWGNNGDFYGSSTYYGFHPYPDWNTEYQHFWEIATPPGSDVVGPAHVVYDRWYTQVAVCRADGEQRVLEFYWDWPDTTKVIRHRGPIVSDPPEPALVIGDAPWNAGNEVWNGVLRGFQFYDAALTVDEIAREIADPGSVRSPWYLNLDPTPKDIADQSGHGNHPAWVGNERPTLWTGLMTPDGIIYDGVHQ